MVKPSKLRYTAEINCHHRNLSITIGRATHFSVFGEAGSTGYVNIRTDLSSCDHHIPTVKVRLTNHLYHSESVEFEFLKTELSTRRTAVVLGFNIEPSARKHFYFQQSSSILRFSQRRLVDYYELEIECDYQPSWTQHIVFGSEVQKHGQNGINIPIYEIEMMAFCSRGKIRLVIYNAERERTEIDVTTKFLLDNNAFNINMSNKTIQPTQGRTENDDPVLSTTIAWRGASSSTTGHTEASTMATAHDEAITLSQAGDTESEVDEMEPKQQSEKNEAVSEQNICKICLNKKREIAFVPCGHFCACRECSKSIYKCPICRQQIKEDFLIYFSHSLNIPSGASSSITKQTQFNNNECVFCRKGQPEIAFLPCKHFGACSECSEDIIKKKNECPICRQKIEKPLHIYFS